MTIRSGDKYVVESVAQFVDRTRFDYIDILRAACDEAELLDEVNDIRDECCGREPANSLNELTQAERRDWVAHKVDQPIMDTLAADSQEWVHLYDGFAHRIIKLIPTAQEEAHG